MSQRCCFRLVLVVGLLVMIAKLQTGSTAWAEDKKNDESVNYVPRFQQFIPVPLMKGDVDIQQLGTDSFQDYPRYAIEHFSQIWLNNGWHGRDDWSAYFRWAWRPDEILLRIDVHDDVLLMANSPSLSQLDGDYFLLKFQAKNTGPIGKDEVVRVLLRPDVEAGQCSVNVFAGTDIKRYLGKIEALVKKTGPSDYTLLLRLKTDQWLAKPEEGKQFRAQIIAGDSDEKGKVNHVFALFPRTVEGMSFLQSLGTFYCVKDVWLRPSLVRILNKPEKLDLQIDWGNLTDDELELGIELLSPSGKIIRSWEKLFRLIPGSRRQGTHVSLNIKGLKPGQKYLLRAKAGVYYDPSTIMLFLRPQSNWLIPAQFNPQPPIRSHRRLNLSDEEQRLALQMLGGAGTLLWHLGYYDGTCSEFNIEWGPVKETSVKVTAENSGKKGVAPAHLPGGMDPDYGCGTPLVLDLEHDFVFNPAVAPIRSPTPFNKTLGDDTKAQKLSDSAQRLLLIGFLALRHSKDQAPHLVVKDDHNRVLASEWLVPGHSDFVLQWHTYVLRVWLNGSEKKLYIRNANKFGFGAYLDFMALLGGNKEPVVDDYYNGTVRFHGPQEAKLMNRLLDTQLF
ncbi:MAG: hypothetical protein D6820_13815, partial [Lentisphaerae bacterium]